MGREELYALMEFAERENLMDASSLDVVPKFLENQYRHRHCEVPS